MYIDALSFAVAFSGFLKMLDLGQAPLSCYPVVTLYCFPSISMTSDLHSLPLHIMLFFLSSSGGMLDPDTKL